MSNDIQFDPNIARLKWTQGFVSHLKVAGGQTDEQASGNVRKVFPQLKKRASRSDKLIEAVLGRPLNPSS